jgi:hypothetical protein
MHIEARGELTLKGGEFTPRMNRTTHVLQITIIIQYMLIEKKIHLITVVDV